MAKPKKETTAVTLHKEKEPVPAYPAIGGELAVGNLKLKIKQLVTIPHLKSEEGKPVAIRIVSPIYTGDKIVMKDKDGNVVKQEDGKKPPQLVRCINLEDNQTYTYILGAVAESNILRLYKDESYVGKSFIFLKGPKLSGKAYHQYAVAEVEE